MTVLAALLGVGVHFLTSLPHLVAAHTTGVRHLPLRIPLKIGAPRPRVASGLFTGLVPSALLAAASKQEATMIVMGAYTHSRLRQSFLGGVTNKILAEASIPFLMRH